MAKGRRGFLGSLMFWLLSGNLGCGGMAVALIILCMLAYLAYFFAVNIVVPGIKLLLLLGLLFGAGITIRNYVLALYHNIKPERVIP